MWKVPALFEIMDVHLSMINICGNPKIFLKEKIHLRNKAIMHVLPSEEIQTTCTCIFVMSATINKCAQNLSDLNTLQNFLPHLFQLLSTLKLKVNSKPITQGLHLQCNSVASTEYTKSKGAGAWDSHRTITILWHLPSLVADGAMKWCTDQHSQITDSIVGSLTAQ